jgi:hypothetical protein
MKSFSLGLGIVGVLAASGCPSDDTGDSGNDSLAATSNEMTDTGMESTSGSAEETTGGAALSHATDIQPIWDEHCVTACHETGGEWSVLDMSEDAYGSIVDVAAATFSDLDHVEPGDPTRSYLWHKIEGTHLSVGGNGVAMPKPPVGGGAATVLTDDQKSTIEAWITGGANP